MLKLMTLTPGEQAERAEQIRLERILAEKARQETRNRVEILTAKLRSLGIDPDTI